MPISRLLPLLLLFSALFLPSCSDASDEGSAQDSTSLPEEVAAKENVVITPDSVWIARGMPDPARVWNAEEMGKAYQVLLEEGNRDGDLPRYDSTGKNRVFARLMSLENVEFFRNDSLSLDERINIGSQSVAAYAQIYMLYVGPAMSRGVYVEEVTQLMANLLKVEARFSVLIADFVETVPQDQRENEQFKMGMRQVRAGLAQSMNGAIEVLRDKGTFSSRQLETIAAALKETAPVMLPYLEDEQRAQLLTEAEKTIAETENETIKSVLRELFPSNPSSSSR